MKKILLVMILIFSLSFFTGCNKQSNIKVDDFIMLSLDISSNGRVIQSIDFSVGGDKFKQFDVSEVEKSQFIANLQNEITQIRNEFLMNFTLIYIANPKEEYKLNSGLLFSNVAYDSANDTVGFDMVFTSVGAWNYYHNTSSQNSETNNDTNIFVSKNISQGTFPFSAKINLGDGESIYVGERYKQRYLQALDGLSVESKLKGSYNPTLIYNYSTYYSRLHSNADIEYTDEINHSHHVWMVESQNLTADNSIQITSYTIHTSSWYILALVFTIVLGFILYVILDYKNIKNFFRNKRQKRIK